MGWPDSEWYLKHFPSFARAFGGKAFTPESAYYADGYTATVLRLPSNVYPDEDKLVSLLQRTVSEKIQKDFFPVFEQMSRYHPREPYWYLPLIRVDPSRRGRGFGSALLQHALMQCDRDSKLTYFESSNPKDISLYQRRGFELLDAIHARTSRSIFPMLRRPR